MQSGHTISGQAGLGLSNTEIQRTTSNQVKETQVHALHSTRCTAQNDLFFGHFYSGSESSKSSAIAALSR